MRSLFRRRRSGLAALALAAGTALSGAALTPSASAETVPAFGFDKCPALPSGADPTWWNCNVAIITGGRFTLGALDQAITSPITLTYAVGFAPVTLEQKVIVGGFQADKMLVRPGVFGDPIFTAVYARPEYAGFMDLQNGDVLLNLKVKVINPNLGPYCSIGSTGDPIRLHLTIGTTSPPPPNQPISGSPPADVSTDPLVFKLRLVDKAFAVPGSSGCGPGGLFDGIVDWRAGLPAKAGTNTVVFDQYLASTAYTDLPA
ncbi:MAG TPA: hypothetical protein VFV01_23805 [Spirillospora sp.]|nr:hypothetical protein [Spirillospora sp.]